MESEMAADAGDTSDLSCLSVIRATKEILPKLINESGEASEGNMKKFQQKILTSDGESEVEETVNQISMMQEGKLSDDDSDDDIAITKIKFNPRKIASESESEEESLESQENIKVYNFNDKINPRKITSESQSGEDNPESEDNLKVDNNLNDKINPIKITSESQSGEDNPESEDNLKVDNNNLNDKLIPRKITSESQSEEDKPESQDNLKVDNNLNDKCNSRKIASESQLEDSSEIQAHLKDNNDNIDNLNDECNSRKVASESGSDKDRSESQESTEDSVQEILIDDDDRNNMKGREISRRKKKLNTKQDSFECSLETSRFRREEKILLPRNSVPNENLIDFIENRKHLSSSEHPIDNTIEASKKLETTQEVITVQSDDSDDLVILYDNTEQVSNAISDKLQSFIQKASNFIKNDSGINTSASSSTQSHCQLYKYTLMNAVNLLKEEAFKVRLQVQQLDEENVPGEDYDSLRENEDYFDDECSRLSYSTNQSHEDTPENENDGGTTSECVELFDNQEEDDFSSSYIPSYQPGGGFREDNHEREHTIDASQASCFQQGDIAGSPRLIDHDTYAEQTSTTKNSTELFDGSSYSDNNRCTAEESIANSTPSCSDKFSPEEIIFKSGSTSPDSSSLPPPSFSDLLPLCSGNFSNTPITSDDICTPKGSSSASSARKSFTNSESIQSSGEDSVCSENFASIIKRRKRKFNISDSEEDNTENVVDQAEESDSEEDNTENVVDQAEESASCVDQNRVLQETSTDSESVSEKIIECSDDEVEDSASDSGNAGDEEDNSDDDEVEESASFAVQNLVVQESHTVDQYFENEAELSGDEVSDDEEEEDGDYVKEDDVTVPSAEKIRSQIGPLHAKQLQDYDQHVVKLLQEQLLEDGDLHMDGPGRNRKFTWLNKGEDDGKNSSDEMSEAENDANEDRLTALHKEKIKWRNEQKLEEDAVELEKASLKPKNSQFQLNIMGKNENTKRISLDPLDELCLPGTSCLHGSKKRKRDSVAYSETDAYKNTLKMMKVSDHDTSGSVTTKHYVFSNENQKKETSQNVSAKLVSKPKSPPRKNFSASSLFDHL